MSFASLHAIAVAAAASKILPLPSEWAFWRAVLYTFSNTRGTERMKSGLYSAKVGTRLGMSLVWPTEAPASNAAMLTARARTCASGRNISVLTPGVVSRSPRLEAMMPLDSAIRFEWVSWQPFGRPVVPEV